MTRSKGPWVPFKASLATWWPRSTQRATKVPQYLTLNWEHGYENRWTFPKSSPVTRRLLSLDLQAALMSVPSEPSGHKPEEQRGPRDVDRWDIKT